MVIMELSPLQLQEDIALLQFVALALPAVAILIEAVVRFQERFVGTSTEVRLQTEFHLLEFVFLGLVLAGIVFSISILQNTDSIITAIGILLLAGSLALIFPATWFAFRRAKYPTQSFDSPEQYVKHGVITSVKIAATVGIPLFVIVGTLQFFAPSEFLNLIPRVDIRRLAILLILISLSIGSASVFFQFYLNYTEKRMAKDWMIEVHKLLGNIERRLSEDSIRKEDTYNLGKLRRISVDSVEEIQGLRNEAPPAADENISAQLDNLIYAIEGMSDLIKRLEEVETDIDRFQLNLEKAMSSKEEAEQVLSEDFEDISDFTADEAIENLHTAEDYITQVESKLEQLENQRANLDDRLQIQIANVRGSIERVKSDVEEKL